MNKSPIIMMCPSNAFVHRLKSATVERFIDNQSLQGGLMWNTFLPYRVINP